MSGSVRGRSARPSARSDHGQATVELALVLPVLILFLFALVQTALVARNEILLQESAHAAAREASVDAGIERVRGAANGDLRGVEVDVHRTDRPGDPVTVVVHYRDRTNLPLVGPLFPDLTLHATVTMRDER